MTGMCEGLNSGPSAINKDKKESSCTVFSGLFTQTIMNHKKTTRNEALDGMLASHNEAENAQERGWMGERGKPGDRIPYGMSIHTSFWFAPPLKLPPHCTPCCSLPFIIILCLPYPISTKPLFFWSHGCHFGFLALTLFTFTCTVFIFLSLGYLD